MRNDIPSMDQLPAWAVANSISSASKILHKKNSKVTIIEPCILSSNRISLTKHGSLVFSNHNLLQAVKVGFAMPEIISLFKTPIKSIGAIQTVTKIRKLYFQQKLTIHQVQTLLQGGLASTICYANNDSYSKSIIMNESGCIDFSVNGHLLARVIKNACGNWELASSARDLPPSVSVKFRNLKTVYRAAIGKIDPLVDPAENNINVQGKIPLLEKFGYISRLSMRNVPIPRELPNEI